MKDEERLKRRGRSGDNHIAGRHRLGEREREEGPLMYTFETNRDENGKRMQEIEMQHVCRPEVSELELSYTSKQAKMLFQMGRLQFSPWNT